MYTWVWEGMLAIMCIQRLNIFYGPFFLRAPPPLVHASDVLVEDCHFGGAAFGARVPHGHGASIGSIGSNTRLEDITFRRILFENTHVGPNIKIHGDAVDCYVRDVVYEDLVIRNASLENLYIHCDYGGDGTGRPGIAAAGDARRGRAPAPAPTTPGSQFVVENIVFKNSTATGAWKLGGGFDCSEKVKCVNITMVGIHSDSPARAGFEQRSERLRLQQRHRERFERSPPDPVLAPLAACRSSFAQTRGGRNL